MDNDDDANGVDHQEEVVATAPHHHRGKPISFSQPLSSPSHPNPRRSALRKHSLDEDRLHHESASFFSDNASRSYSCPHYSSPSHPDFQPHQEYHLPHPHLPPPRPPSSSSIGFSSSSDHRDQFDFGNVAGALPEFAGRGGGSGIFKVPDRAAVLSGRPPPLELRPHPHRETQVGSFLRTIACTKSQLWAGQESGVRVWNLSDLFGGWNKEGFGSGKIKRGDEETAPFRESCRTSPALCLVVDAANGLVWSGHKDGRVRSWRMDHSAERNESADRRGSSAAAESPANANGMVTTNNLASLMSADGGSSVKEGLSWHAHRTPILSMVITSYGELWTGTEGGVIKVWPWEPIEKALSLASEERHMASLLVERSYVDLRNSVTVGGVCSLPVADIKYLLSDNSRSKVWSGGFHSFALWDSRTKELLKVFNIDGQVETRIDNMPTQDSYAEDDMKTKFVSTSKKEKSQGPLSFFQRSRNALLGAADAVRRVAVKGTFGEDYRRTEALTMSMDGMIWMGCTNGSLIQWDGNGHRIRELQHHSSSIKCLCAFGTRLWVGYVSGTIQVMDLEGNLLGGWLAHNSPIIKMAVGGSYIFTLANHGGMRGWSLTSPGPLDDRLRSDLTNKEDLYTKFDSVKILAGTWNVGQERASHDSLMMWLGGAASEVGVVVVGLQEVEMGAGFLAMAAAKETVGLEGSANGQWWLDAIGKTLDEGSSFDRVGSRQLAGLLIAVWARKNLRLHIGDVYAAAVPCGFGRAIGNKGAVGLRMRVYDRIMCFVNCHLAAHLEAVNRRNADFDHIYRTMSFSRPSVGLHAAAAGASAVQSHRGANGPGIHADDGKPELSEADMIVFLGDFNYRLHSITYDEARDMVSQRLFDWLREKDQLRTEMKAGKVFQGLREAQIRFPPTYKFERRQAGLSGYDSGEKKRIPAWCDRILYRDSRSISLVECSLECPVVSSISEYDSCMDVIESDHKPVRCVFNVDIAHVDELTRRQEYGAIIASNEEVRLLLEEHREVPETTVSTNDIILHNEDKSFLRITNKCDKKKAVFEIFCEGQSTIKEDENVSELQARSSFGLPHWLKLIPAIGVLKPGQATEVTVHHEEFYTLEEYVDGIPQNWWCEDTRDKEVVLIVNISGSTSTESKSHRIRVRHSFSSKNLCSETQVLPKKIQPNYANKSDFAHFGNPSDAVNVCHMRFL